MSWKEEWNKYCNKHWKGANFGGIHLEVQEDFGYEFIENLLQTRDKEIRAEYENACKHLRINNDRICFDCGEVK